jgi:glucose-6-phosphate isomerase
MKENVWVDAYTSLGDYEGAIYERINELGRGRLAERLWNKDATLWKNEEKDRKLIVNALGWLDSPGKMESNLRELVDFADEVRAAGFEHVVHMGMGGSSLAPLAFQETFAVGPNGLPLTVLDTTDPATILGIEKRIPPANTLFIEASKSGSTVESRSFGEYFYGRVKAVKGDRAGENFAVITDPGSMLAALAKERGYRKIFLNFADIGGRYSALSYFGLVPAALMGMDIFQLLDRGLQMARACGASMDPAENPGVALGVVMGELAGQGRNKLTLLVPDSIATLGMWLEQLIAESTGKEGMGILPVTGEVMGSPSVYGTDRVFVYLRMESEVDDALDKAAKSLLEAGFPLVTIRMRDRFDLGRELFRWEIATAVSGVVLGINPFDQPNVQEAKDLTNRLLKEVREHGRLPAEEPSIVEESMQLYGAGGPKTVGEALSRFLEQAHEGDYIALLAYMTEDEATNRALQSIRAQLRDRLHVATTLGYGPRYLHSTGQLHKGGPNTGLFLELTADDGEDVEIPGQPYSFGALRRAQALGDLEALRQHGRRGLRFHLGSAVSRGLAVLERAIGQIAPR